MGLRDSFGGDKKKNEAKIKEIEAFLDGIIADPENGIYQRGSGFNIPKKIMEQMKQKDFYAEVNPSVTAKIFDYDNMLAKMNGIDQDKIQELRAKVDKAYNAVCKKCNECSNKRRAEAIARAKEPSKEEQQRRAREEAIKEKGERDKQEARRRLHAREHDSNKYGWDEGSNQTDYHSTL